MRNFSSLLQDALAAKTKGQVDEFFDSLSDDERKLFDAGISETVEAITKAMEPIAQAIQEFATQLTGAFSKMLENAEFKRLLDEQQKLEEKNDNLEVRNWN